MDVCGVGRDWRKWFVWEKIFTQKGENGTILWACVKTMHLSS
jgi:hypothetical protein